MVDEQHSPDDDEDDDSEDDHDHLYLYNRKVHEDDVNIKWLKNNIVHKTKYHEFRLYHSHY